MTEAILLHNGNGGTPMVRIEPDATCPRMWRMHWPDGRVSDMGDLTRIRDVAAAICERGPPARNRQVGSSWHSPAAPTLNRNSTFPRGLCQSLPAKDSGLTLGDSRLSKPLQSRIKQTG
jgi:hypothetical protein